MRNAERGRLDAAQPDPAAAGPTGQPDEAPDAAAPSPGSATPPASAARSGGRSAGRGRLSTRLGVMLLPPVIAALAAGGCYVNDSVQRWQQAEDAVHTAQLVGAATGYGRALLDERDLSAAPLLSGDRGSPQVARARAATDQAADRFDAAITLMPETAALRRRLAAFRTVESRLPTVRAQAYTSRLPGNGTEEAYRAIELPLTEFADALAGYAGAPAADGRALYAMAQAAGADSMTRALGIHLLNGSQGGSSGRQLAAALGSYAALEGIALSEFRDEASAPQLARLTAAEAGARRQTAAAHDGGAPSRTAMITALASGESPGALSADGVTSANWTAAATPLYDAYATVQTSLADQAEHDASAAARSALRRMVEDAAGVLLGVLAALGLARLLARPTLRRVRELRASALEVAQRRLPSLVDQLSRTDPSRVDTRVEPLPVRSGDELGDVARAFDQVHREAVRLAGEHGALRGDVNGIFANLGNRNQGLIEGQLSLITDLENNETDPDQLAGLFRLDRLTTRMRRTGENLLVLAGEEPGRQWGQPIPLLDVVRSAAAQVEAGERVEITALPQVEIDPSSVADLVHLLAELLENATCHSSPLTAVTVGATRLPDGRTVVSVHDQGIGLTAADRAEINRRLADPPAPDAAASRRMGLLVIGRLAGRHGIKVQLHPTGEHGGTTSLVMLPQRLVLGGLEGPGAGAGHGMRHAGSGTPGGSGIPGAAGAAGASDRGGETIRPPRPAPAPYGAPFPAGPHGTGPAPSEARPRERHETGRAPSTSIGAPFAASSAAFDPVFDAPSDPAAGFSLAPSFDPSTDPLNGPLSPDPLDTGRAPSAPPGAPFGAPPASSGALPAPSGAPLTPSWAPSAPTGAPFPPEPPYAGHAPSDAARTEPAPTGFSAPAPSDHHEPPLPSWQDPTGPAAFGPPPTPFGAPPTPFGLPDTPPAGDDQHTGHAPYALPGAPSGASAPLPGAPSSPEPPYTGHAPSPRQEPSAAPAAFSAPVADRAAGSPAAGDPRGIPGAGESGAPDTGAPERVGYDASENPLTEDPAGAVRRGDRSDPDPAGRIGEPTAPRGGRYDTAEGRSTNDELRRRAEQTRAPRAGGVTLSGLPMRVPRANLVAGAAQPTAEPGGAQVSRDPRDVGGRLSDLRRGVQQGRGAAPDPATGGYPSPTDSEGHSEDHGPNPQER